MSMEHQSEEMQACIAACTHCAQTCLGMAMNHCLELGGAHVAKPHFTLMLACAEMCRTSAQFMLMGSDLHRRTCALCAEICTQCADDCEQLGGMEGCVAACRACAESCRKMA